MSKGMSLEAFAKAHPTRKGGVRCWLCGIPEVTAVNKGRASGVTFPTLRDWLVKECGYPPEVATVDKIRGHFQSGHPEFAK
jgi:hypothetical protein